MTVFTGRHMFSLTQGPSASCNSLILGSDETHVALESVNKWMYIDSQEVLIICKISSEEIELHMKVSDYYYIWKWETWELLHMDKPTRELLHIWKWVTWELLPCFTLKYDLGLTMF